MAIERITNTLGLAIQEEGSQSWGLVLNNNFDILDSGILSDRTRIASLENTNAILPLAIAGKVGHNLLRNNIFTLGTIVAPEIPTSWTAQFLNGAVGNATRTNQTFLVGTHSLRVSIASVNTAPSAQLHPYPGLNILDPVDNSVLANFDTRQLTNGFGLEFQTVSLSPKTKYTLSAYGKAEIPNPSLGINCHWKVGIVFKDTGGAVLFSYFTPPQINRTNNINTSSFERAQLTFITPDLPVVNAEVWLVTEGSIPSGIGSAWFDGAQLEQATQATSLELFSVRSGNFAVDGDLIIGGNLVLQQENLFFSGEITFSGNVQIGDDITEDILDVYTKAATFHGPLTVLGDVVLGNNAEFDEIQVVAKKTTFYDNQNPSAPQGGDVEIQGDLLVRGSTTLGDNITEDTVTLNAQLVSVGFDLTVSNDLDVNGFLNVERGVVLGSNSPITPFDTLVVKMQDGGSFFEGDVELKHDLFVKGNTTLGDFPSDTLVVNAGSSSLYGSLFVQNDLLVQGASTFNIGSGSGDNFTVVANDFLITSTGTTQIATSNLNVTGSLTLNSGTIASISSSSVNFAVAGLPSNTFDVYSLDAYFSNDGYFGGDVEIFGDISSQGDSFQFGNAFSADPSGELEIGNSAAITANTYDNTLRVYAGNTFFGDFGSQKKGHVEVGGNFKAAGSVTLGNSLTEDLLVFQGNQINVNVGSGSIKFNGGFQNYTYDPLTPQGGITVDRYGNLAMDGKLTVKGPLDPVQLIISPLLSNGSNVLDVIKVTSPTLNPNTTFKVTSLGQIFAERSLTLDDGYIHLSNTNTNFGQLSGDLLAFNVYSKVVNLNSNVNVSGTLSAGDTIVEDFVANNGSFLEDLSVAENLVVQKNITSNGTSYIFGSAPSSTTVFDVRANTIFLGKDGQNIGNVTIGNNLYVRKDVTVGFPGQYNNEISINAAKINIDVSSKRPSNTELAGFRVGGGYQNNPYDSFVQDHGGVTIDAYGNIFADGLIKSKGPLGFDSLILTVPVGGYPSSSIFTIMDDSTDDGYVTLDIDGYGSIDLTVSPGRNPNSSLLTIINNSTGGSFTTFDIDGYGFIDAKNMDVQGRICFDAYDITNLELGTSLGDPLNPSYIVMCVDKGLNRVLDIDNFGNLRSYSYIHTTQPGRSNLSTCSVTVGNGTTTFGDFNSAGPVAAYSNPIQQAINSLPSGGSIFLKKGTYTITSNLTIPANISIQGEGETTIINGSGTYSINITGNAVKLEDLKIQNMVNGVLVNSGVKRVSLKGLFITSSATGIQFNGDESVITGCFVTDNTVNGIVVTGANNAVATNVTIRNP
jgi:hypothetical protein